MLVRERSSFRDPTSQVMADENQQVIRLIYPSYFLDYQHLMQSGLYTDLIVNRLMVKHEEVSASPECITIKPDVIPFISYPYEWAFHQLRAAGLVTLEIMQLAMQHGMVLKDASAFNIQYSHKDGRWMLIDTTSFERYIEGKPWQAYGQFIRHFLMPLLLCKYRDPAFLKLFQSNIDGLKPADFAPMLPLKSLFNVNDLMFAHSYRWVKNDKRTYTMSRIALERLIARLYDYVQGLKYRVKSSWSHYSSATEYVNAKKNLVIKELNSLISKEPGMICDVGANTGDFSLIAARLGGNVVAIDYDHDSIEAMTPHNNILPLVVDLCNPSPSLGWQSTERKSFLSRAHFVHTMALAVIHHMCVTNNIPLEQVARQLHSITSKGLIIEFVEPADPRFCYIARDKTFPPYSQAIFEEAFRRYFDIECKERIGNSCRILYTLLAR